MKFTNNKINFWFQQFSKFHQSCVLYCPTKSIYYSQRKAGYLWKEELTGSANTLSGGKES